MKHKLSYHSVRWAWIMSKFVQVSPKACNLFVAAAHSLPIWSSKAAPTLLSEKNLVLLFAAHALSWYAKTSSWHTYEQDSSSRATSPWASPHWHQTACSTALVVRWWCCCLGTSNALVGLYRWKQQSYTESHEATAPQESPNGATKAAVTSPTADMLS